MKSTIELVRESGFIVKDVSDNSLDYVYLITGGEAQAQTFRDLCEADLKKEIEQLRAQMAMKDDALRKGSVHVRPTCDELYKILSAALSATAESSEKFLNEVRIDTLVKVKTMVSDGDSGHTHRSALEELLAELRAKNGG